MSDNGQISILSAVIITRRKEVTGKAIPVTGLDRP
jgi:hypothetical protein